MKQQKSTPPVRRFTLALYGGILGGLLALVLLSWHMTNQVKELERRVEAVAEEQEQTIQEAERFLDILEGLEHDFEAGDPARGGVL